MVDFNHMMSIAKRSKHAKGEKLITQNGLNSNVFLLQSGSACVYRDNAKIGAVAKHQFIGEGSYLRWREHMEAKAPADTSNLLSAAPVHPPPPPLPTATITTTTTTSSTSTTVPTVTNPPLSKFTDHSVATTADVVCVENCVVYSWNFDELIQMDSAVELALHRCIMSDLNRKLHLTVEPVRYRATMLGALLDANVVSSKKKEYLSALRRELQISLADHISFLNECGWTIEQYDRGSKDEEEKEEDN